MGGPLGEDGHHVTLGQGGVTLSEGVVVADRPTGVGLAAHEHHPQAAQEQAAYRHLAQAGLGDEARRAAQGGGDEDRIHEPVEVVGHQQHRSVARVSLLARHLQAPEQQRGCEAPYPRHHPPHGRASIGPAWQDGER